MRRPRCLRVRVRSWKRWKRALRPWKKNKRRPYARYSRRTKRKTDPVAWGSAGGPIPSPSRCRQGGGDGMTLALVHSRAAVGIEAPAVAIEVHIANGLPALSIVGLPEAAVRESKDRVKSAIVNSGFQFPNRRITVNLAPADLPKEGGGFDLPIALGILVASGQLQAPLENFEFVGELALS